MARSVKEIQDGMIASIQADANLNTILTNTSKTARWRLFTYIFAVCANIVELLFDQFKKDVNSTIALLKPHSKKWYAEKAKLFLYGYPLVNDADYYDTSLLTETEIETASIITQVAVDDNNRGLLMKVATADGEDLRALTGLELAGFVAYMDIVKDAGVKLFISSKNGDLLKLVLRIYYNPLVLNSLGERIDGSDATPVQKAIKNYLQNLPFNGVFVLAHLVDTLQAVEGVEIPVIDSANVAPYLSEILLAPYQTVDVKYIPAAGYLRLATVDGLTVTYIAQTPL
jgi:hypothetical protein